MSLGNEPDGSVRAEKKIQGYWGCDGLRRLIDNLADNAVKYGYPYTPITVSLDQDDRTVRIAVHNQGKALLPEEQATLFEPFRRTQSAENSGKKGWGIGLTLVRGIVEAHDGSIRVESAPGKGTTFTILLPNDARRFQTGRH